MRAMSPALPPVAVASTAEARPVLAAVERELARYVGPLAAALVPRAARHHTTLEGLAQALLPLIESHKDREAFARAMARLAAATAPRAAAAVPAAPAVPVAEAPCETPAPRLRTGPAARGALLRAADAALATIVQQRHGGHAAPPAMWREQLRAFEADAAACGATPQHVELARALLDDFHAEALLSPRIAAPDDPLRLLERLCADPAAHAPLFELGLVCIALGYQGRWRGRSDAATCLGALATRLSQCLPDDTAAVRTLSPHWQGLVTRGPDDAALLPLWVAVALGIVATLALWFALNARLDAQARPMLARIAAVPAALQAPARAAPKLRLAALLPAALDGTPIDVRDEARRSVVTLPADALFAAGTARIEAKGQALLAHVAEVLRGQPGEVTAIGHGDDAPAASLQYPSNWHFTRARAQAVADALRALGVPGPRAEGRAEFEPRTSDTAGRSRNRRIEIELRLPRPNEDAS
jgi:type VI secretion system protein ImpK